jgi:hypothetical protein
MVGELTDLMLAGTAAQEQDNDLEMVQAAMPANIKLLESLLASSPANRDLLILLSRQYAGYAFGFLETDLEEIRSDPSDTAGTAAARLRQRMSRYYEKGADYALRALEIDNPDSRRKLAVLSSAAAFIRATGRQEVPALFWYGFNLSGFVNLNRDSMRALSRAHLVEKTMQRVVELNPAYFHHGAHLVLLAYYGSRSPMMGGNPQAALQHYRILDEATDHQFLLNDLFYARYYLVQIQDREAFERTLAGIETRAGTIETYRLFNAIAAKRAPVYLQSVDRFFESDSE